jgi:hypothetical protein
MIKVTYGNDTDVTLHGPLLKHRSRGLSMQTNERLTQRVI